MQFCGRVDGVEPRRHRADAVAGTPSRRRRQRECPYTPPRCHAATLSTRPRAPPRAGFGLDKDDPRAAAEKVARACAAAGLDEVAARLPQGLETPAGAAGTLLSGGQRQRVSIARALLRDPAVIVLDEPSSALDARSEALIQQTLDRLDCSLLIVAHRLATIKACDRIYVMESGTVVEEGTHAELVERGGVYAGMVERQSFGD